MSRTLTFHVKHRAGVGSLLGAMTASLPGALGAAAEAIGVPLRPHQLASLETYEDLLRDRAVPLGLVAASDVSRLRKRHVLDCLRAAAVVEPGDRDAYDLGSGAGLPGVVVAIARPGLFVALVESRRRKASFLELVVDRLGLGNVRVEAVRVEDLALPVDVCFARAFAHLDRSWRAAEPLLRNPGGRLVYFAGRSTRTPSVPVGVSVHVRTTPVLASSGPLVIMARQ